MAAPTTITAGDTLKWTQALDDFPASLYTLVYRLLPESGGTPIEIESTADGETHSVTVDAKDSADYVAGAYRMVAYVFDIETEAERYTQTALAGRVTILPDPASSTVADQRSESEKMLASLKTAYSALVAKNVSATTIDGNTYTLRNLDELQRQIAYWTRKVAAETMDTEGGNNVYVRFGSI